MVLSKATFAKRKTWRAGYEAFKKQKANLPEPPDVFEEGAHYHVQMTHSVQLDDGTWLRPADHVVIRGDIATKHASKIIAAKRV